MSRRSPARFLAPLALVAVGVALFAVVNGNVASDEREASPGATPASTASAGKGSDAKKRKSRGRRTYTVKQGDTPSGIAEKTGVPVQRLLDLNPDLDPQ